MAEDRIDLAGLPYGLPGSFDTVAGVDTATGRAKQFPMPQAGEPKDYPTRASLPSAAGLPEGTAAHVNNDPNPDNNGRWAVFGGAWVQSADRVSGLEGRVSATEPVVAALKAEAESGAYVEVFAGNSPITATNLTDSATPVQTYAYSASGLTINLTTGSRTIRYSTKNVIGGKRARITLTQVVNSGTGTSIGPGFSIGGKAYWYTANGRVTTTDGGENLTTTAPTFTTPVTIKTVIDIDDAGNMSATWSHAGGSVTINRSGVAMGEFALAQRGPINIRHSMTVEALGGLVSSALAASATQELSHADRDNLNAIGGLLSQLARAVPIGLSIPVPYGLKPYKASGVRDFFTNIDLHAPLTEGDIGVTTVYVDPVAGSDTNPGTAAAPFKSLFRAVGTSAHKLIVKAKPVLYDKDTCWGSKDPAGSIVQVVPWGDGDIISSCHHSGLAWAAAGSNTYAATIVDVSTVADASVLTADGDFSVLDRLTSLAAVQATAGSYFVSGTTVYVHTSDNRAPDSSVRVYRSFSTLSNGRAMNPGQTLYMERVRFHGGNAAFASRLASAATSATILARDCEFSYAGGDGFDINGHYLCVLQGCVAAQNTADGFNYHAIFGSDGPDVIEVDCIGRWNGRTAEGTNNGTTLHDPTSVAVRVGGDYHHNQNRNVHDIGGSMSWNLGCTSRDSQTPTSSNWCAGLSTESVVTRMWLDTCNSSGTNKDLEAPAGKGVIYTFDLISGGDNVAGADIQTYQA